MTTHVLIDWNCPLNVQKYDHPEPDLIQTHIISLLMVQNAHSLVIMHQTLSRIIPPPVTFECQSQLIEESTNASKFHQSLCPALHLSLLPIKRVWLVALNLTLPVSLL